MNINDFIKNRMSTDPTADYLRIQGHGHELSEFREVFLTANIEGSGTEHETRALEDMARQAMDEGCMYVANIQPLRGRQEEYPSGLLAKLPRIFPKGYFEQRTLLLGMGLKKNKPFRLYDK